ncbi:hypothetical protein PCANC_16184 [Puccinia coronata f. sp. avenae]|uniref:Uncharacterized protein n=1 Tax=Puccinia coronata f. sp. avenae TaxID=200324 RepID=A0A2N5UF53_9BASI|nr:hypothetical protein PCANC_19597 [Puccinia coronata f. sp. avenae]PLW36379.1 hypothetical protein PCANC_16184 [Puccinia coronata f. sp. avenae]
MHGNFKIYQTGQEVQITGHIVDFDMNLQITIVMVDFVAITSGHGSSRGTASVSTTAGSPSKAGRNFYVSLRFGVKFDSRKGKTQTLPPKGLASGLSPSAYMKPKATPVRLSKSGKGKEKAHKDV